MSSKSTTKSKTSDAFADWKSGSFKQARRDRTETGAALDPNGYHVQAKLPPDLYQGFYSLLKAKGFTKSTGVQYAIFKLLESESNV